MRKNNTLTFFLVFLVSLNILNAEPSTPLPDNAFDGGPVSAESLSRGHTYAAGPGSLGSGSENPASLIDPFPNSLYSTVLVSVKSDLPEGSVRDLDPIRNRVLQYLAIGGEKGALFFEPLGRLDERHDMDISNPGTDYQDVKFSADAVGFAGAEKMGSGSVGLSLAYLRGSLNSARIKPLDPDTTELDNGNGVRFNLGFRYPTGPVSWGLTLQNFPGFMWWKHHRRDLLPVKVRVGQIWRATQGILFSADVETRYYNEGANRDTYYYIGNETYLSPRMGLRLGAFTSDINDSTMHHYTGGITFQFSNNVDLVYGMESFKELDSLERIKKHFISLRIPFFTEST